MNPKNSKFGDSKLPFGNLQKLCHFYAIFIIIYEIYYREERINPSQVWVMVSHLNVFFDFVFAPFLS